MEGVERSAGPRTTKERQETPKLKMRSEVPD